MKRWKVGDKVTALVPGGGYAEYAVAHETNALPVIAQLSMVEAGAIPETFFTVWHNVFERGALKAGETMLIHGGSSGIGTTAIMLAKANGARVIVTVGSEEKAEACRKLGADVAINYNTQDFVAETKKATDGKGAELIVDMVAGEYIQKNYEAAAMDGRIVQIAFQRPPKFLVDFRPLLMKRLWHTGSGLRPRPVHEKAAIARAVEENVWPLIAAGKVKPVIYKTFPVARCRRCPCADGNEPAYRQDRADELNAVLILSRARRARVEGWPSAPPVASGHGSSAACARRRRDALTASSP